MSNLLQANPRLHLRKMQLADLDSIMLIEPQAFGTHHWTRENFVRELNNQIAFYLVAELNHKVIAYIGAWIVIDEMHIVTLGVDPETRRQGVAEALLIALLNHASELNLRAITLEVRLSNIAAQELYAKYGFQRQGLRKNYYEDNKEAALLLWTEEITSEAFQQRFKANLELYCKRWSADPVQEAPRC